MTFWIEKCLFNDATLCLVQAAEPREPIILCGGQLCEIQRYIGVHCNPQRKRGEEASADRLQYCMMIEGTQLTTVFEKINLEKEKSNTLLVRVAPSTNISVLKQLVDICFTRRTQHLIDIRSGVMLETGVFMYDSMRTFIQGINQFNCSTYKFVAERSYLALR